MKKYPVLLFSIILSAMLMVSCAGSSQISSENASAAEDNPNVQVVETETPSEALLLPQIENDDRFTAAPNGIDTVLLNWEPIAGAEKYLLELLATEEQYVPLALLAGDVTTYEDSDVPAETTFVYRLTAVSGSERGESRQVLLTTPAQVIDPLKVTIEFDQSQPTFDFSNVDTENFDPSTLAEMFPTDALDVGDDGNGSIDLSMFVPIPTTSTSTIGPSGGEVSVTSTNGVVYTLTVPAGALPFDMPITLRPVSAIPDLPLSGGLDAAVFVEPAEIPFNVPATLTILAPEGFVASQGELNIGFAFEAEGEEFHLYPLLENDTLASSGARYAKKMPATVKAGPLAEIAKQQLEKGGGYGKGSGSAQDVRKVNQRPSSKAGNRAAAKAATAQQKSKFVQPVEEAFDEELAPLLTPEQLDFVKQGNAINQKVSKADNWDKLLESVEAFNEYYNKGGSKHNQELNNRILDEMVKKINSFLSKNQAQCLVADDLKAQSLVERLINPGSPAMKAVAAHFKQKFGEKLLNDLTYMVKACSFELDLKSTISYNAYGSTWNTSAEAIKVQLFPIYVNGNLFLYGAGKMSMEQSESGVCNFPIEQYPELILTIRKLVPVFDNGKLVDFALRDYWVAGMEQFKGLMVDDNEKCPTKLQYKGGGNFWTAFFTTARATFGSLTLRDWKITGDTTQGGAITAKWSAVNSSFNPMDAGGKMSENSMITLTIRPYARK